MPTDREKSEEAKERANNKSTSQFDIVGTLCPACNEPVEVLEPDPNEYIREETENGYTNSRAAYEISPKRNSRKRPLKPVGRDPHRPRDRRD
jgi:hypothetical protein